MLALLRFISGRWQMLSLLILTVVTALSLYPLSALPAVPGTDKTYHFIAYGLLMLPVALHRPKYWLWIGLFFFSWSAAIELIQPYVSRHAQWLDLLANGGGLLCGILIGHLLNRSFSQQ